MKSLEPLTTEDVVSAVRSHARVIPHGALTKRPLVAAEPGAVMLDMSGIRGVVEYSPDEFTFTALAGTPLAEIEALLAGHGQYMPFDPALVEQGATIGGTLAAGLNGSGRLRYGGLRDFVIGVRFVDGTGKSVRGGGKVVKNAAGFDLPRLMVGSMGRLGVITELTFKVFPAPRAWCSLRVSCSDLQDAVAVIARLCGRPLEIEALDLEPHATLMIRVAGDASALVEHARRVGTATGRPWDLIAGENEPTYWRAQRGFEWVDPDHWLVKVPLSLPRVSELDRILQRQDVQRRYAVAGNVAWLAWHRDRPLVQLDLGGLDGLVVRGPALPGVSPWLGTDTRRAALFASSVKSALDPDQRLPALL